VNLTAPVFFVDGDDGVDHLAFSLPFSVFSRNELRFVFGQESLGVSVHRIARLYSPFSFVDADQALAINVLIKQIQPVVPRMRRRKRAAGEKKITCPADVFTPPVWCGSGQ